MDFRIELSRKASRMGDKMTLVPSPVVRAFFLAIEKIEALFGEFGNPGRKILRKWSTLSSNSRSSILGLGRRCVGFGNRLQLPKIPEVKRKELFNTSLTVCSEDTSLKKVK